LKVHFSKELGDKERLELLIYSMELKGGIEVGVFKSLVITPTPWGGF
jgi:hypothetical protein